MSGKSGAASIDRRMEEMEAERRELREQIEAARRHGPGQPQSVLRSIRPEGQGMQRGQWKSMGHFLQDVRACPGTEGNYGSNERMKSWVTGESRRLKTMDGMNETIGADGGYLVPPEFASDIMMRVYDNPILGMTTMLPLSSSNTLRVPIVNETSRADGSRFGGVVSYWEGEGDDDALSKGSLAALDIRATRVSASVKATDELLADSPTTVSKYLDIVVPSEIAFRVGQALVKGNGINKPEGIRNSPSKIAVSKETGQSARTLQAENINKMWARLHSGCRENAIWIYDQSIEPQLDGMTIGTASAQMAVYMPPGGLSAARYGTIKGRPAIPVEFCEQVGTEGDIVLWDPSTMLTVSRGGLETAVSMHVAFLSHSQVFRFSLRMGGLSWWRSALTPLSAGDTLSNVVTLETRS